MVQYMERATHVRDEGTSDEKSCFAYRVQNDTVPWASNTRQRHPLHNGMLLQPGVNYSMASYGEQVSTGADTLADACLMHPLKEGPAYEADTSCFCPHICTRNHTG